MALNKTILITIMLKMTKEIIIIEISFFKWYLNSQMVLVALNKAPMGTRTEYSPVLKPYLCAIKGRIICLSQNKDRLKFI